MPYYIEVPFEANGKTETRTIPVFVGSKEEALARAKAQNPDPGFAWDKAEVTEGD